MSSVGILSLHIDIGDDHLLHFQLLIDDVQPLRPPISKVTMFNLNLVGYRSYSLSSAFTIANDSAYCKTFGRLPIRRDLAVKDEWLLGFKFT